MSDFLERTKKLIGDEAVERLKKSKVAVFGVGGVGGHAVDALVRSGVGEIDLFDNDIVVESNINRQLIASYDVIGRDKVDVMKEHILKINPDIKVNTHKIFYLPENADTINLNEYDCIVDAIDTITAKIELIVRAKEAGVFIVSSMGAGNKLNPAMFEVTDIYKTSVCPLAKVMRRELKKRGIKDLLVVYSKEEARRPINVDLNEENSRKKSPGSIAFVPSVAGLIIASEVVRNITKVW